MTFKLKMFYANKTKASNPVAANCYFYINYT